MSDLDSVFLIDTGDDAPITDTVDIVLDEVNDLDTIVRLSLEAYKSMMDDIAFIDVKNRVKHLEVADRYLTTAKDAMYKRDQLIIQRDRLKGSKPTSQVEDSQVSTEGISRDELYERRRARLNAK